MSSLGGGGIAHDSRGDYAMLTGSASSSMPPNTGVSAMFDGGMGMNPMPPSSYYVGGGHQDHYMLPLPATDRYDESKPSSSSSDAPFSALFDAVDQALEHAKKGMPMDPIMRKRGMEDDINPIGDRKRGRLRPQDGPEYMVPGGGGGVVHHDAYYGYGMTPSAPPAMPMLPRPPPFKTFPLPMMAPSPPGQEKGAVVEEW